MATTFILLGVLDEVSLCGRFGWLSNENSFQMC